MFIKRWLAAGGGGLTKQGLPAGLQPEPAPPAPTMRTGHSPLANARQPTQRTGTHENLMMQARRWPLEILEA